jgi:hypothetical protein
VATRVEPCFEAVHRSFWLSMDNTANWLWDRDQVGSWTGRNLCLRNLCLYKLLPQFKWREPFPYYCQCILMSMKCILDPVFSIGNHK